MIRWRASRSAAPGHDPAARLGLLQLALRLEGAPPPTGQLLRHVADDLLQIGHRREIGTFVGVRHVILRG